MKSRKTVTTVTAGLAITSVLLLLCAVVCFVVFKKEEPLQGHVEVLQYCVQPQQKGKLIEVRVKEGDYVEVGDTLALFKTSDTPLPENKTLELLADVIRPFRTGNRAVDNAYGLWQQARAAEEQAAKTYQSIQQKYLKGSVPAHLRDRVFAEYKAQQAQAITARNIYNDELRNMRSKKSGMKGPQIIPIITKVEGEISSIIAKRGELLEVNSPIMNIALLENLWGTFAINAKQRERFKEGDTLQVYCRAFNVTIPMRVSGIKMNRETTATEDSAKRNKEKQTWEMRLRPLIKLDGLRPGMKLNIAKQD